MYMYRIVFVSAKKRIYLCSHNHTVTHSHTHSTYSHAHSSHNHAHSTTPYLLFPQHKDDGSELLGRELVSTKRENEMIEFIGGLFTVHHDIATIVLQLIAKITAVRVKNVRDVFSGSLVKDEVTSWTSEATVRGDGEGAFLVAVGKMGYSV